MFCFAMCTYVLFFIFIQGLIPVLEEWSDRLEHRLCLRHLYANFKKYFGGGTLIRDLMMGAAKATYFQGTFIIFLLLFIMIIMIS